MKCNRCKAEFPDHKMYRRHFEAEHKMTAEQKAWCKSAGKQAKPNRRAETASESLDNNIKALSRRVRAGSW